MDDTYAILTESLTCPITKELFTDPVICDDGHTYNYPEDEGTQMGKLCIRGYDYPG